MILTQSKSLIDKACHLKNQGVSSTREYWHDVLGYNYRMTNICAAIGLAQLEHADEILRKKRELALWYKEGLTGLPLMTHDETQNTRHSFWMCSIILNNPEQQSSLRDFLKASGVETRPFFHPAHTLPHCQSPGNFPVAASLSSRGINLPSSPLLSYADVVRICEAIHSYFKND